MIMKTFVFIAIVSTAIPGFIFAQDSTNDATNSGIYSKIIGPLVTLNKESFADVLMVLLQSQYYNDNTLVLDTHDATTTVLGVDLMVQFEGNLNIEAAHVDRAYVWTSGNLVDMTVFIPKLVVNKTYTIKSAHDPDYISKGYVTLEDENMKLFFSIRIGEVPYFVNSVQLTTQGNITTSIHGEGIPLAEEIQEALQDLLKSQFESVDLSKMYVDVHDKLTDLFSKNSLELCSACKTNYCPCQLTVSYCKNNMD